MRTLNCFFGGVAAIFLVSIFAGISISDAQTDDLTPEESKQVSRMIGLAEELKADRIGFEKSM
jgi:hypothetical protein